MQFVTQVRHNLKGGGDTHLTQRTLIVGPNGSGKSAIINAVELALTGKASDLQGRDLVAADSVLATLTDGSVAYAEAVLSHDGAVARWEGQAKGRAVRTGPAGVFPLRAVTEGLTGSADKARKFLLSHVCAEVTEATVLAAIPGELHQRYRQGSQAGQSPVENLQHVSTEASKRARDTKKTAAASRDVMEAVAAVGVPPAAVANLSDKIAAERTTCVELRTLLAQHAAWQPPAWTVEAIDAEVAATEERVARVEQLVLQMEAPAVPADVEAKAQLRAALRVIVPHNRAATSCVACGSTHKSDPDYADRLESAMAVAEQRAHAAQSVSREAVNMLGQYRAGIRRGQGKIATLRAQREVMADYPPAPEGDVVALREALAYAEREVVRMEAVHTTAQQANATFDAARIAREKHRALLTESRSWAELAGACKQATEDMILDAVARFTARVQRFLPSDDKFGMQLTKTVCRVGLWRDTSLHTAVSGAEWARIMAAVACACTPSEADIPVLVPEDRAWDAKTLKEVLQGLDNYPGQVLVATTVKPFRGVPKGWTTVTLGGGA